MVDIEHDGRDFNTKFFLLAPEIESEKNFCVVQPLSLKTKFIGYLFQQRCATDRPCLITCPNSKQIVSVEPSDEVAFLCPTNVLKTVCDKLAMVGFSRES